MSSSFLGFPGGRALAPVENYSVNEILADDWLDAEFRALEREVLQRNCPHVEEVDTSYRGQQGIYHTYACVHCGHERQSV